MEDKLQLILDYIVRLDGDLNEYRQEVKNEFKQVNEKLDRIEAGQPDDIKAILKQIDKHTRNLTYDIEYLAEKVGKHDVTINRIEKQ
jgi:hypothetical protein